MKIYSREEIRELLPESNLKQWCNEQGIYYYGLIRFLKGKDVSLYTYFTILNRLEICKEVNHYMAERIMYSDIAELERFLKEIHII